MTTTIEMAAWLERQSKMATKEKCPKAAEQLDTIAQRLRELDKLVKAVHVAKGRHHSQIAMCALYEACGLPFQRPINAVKEST